MIDINAIMIILLSVIIICLLFIMYVMYVRIQQLLTGGQCADRQNGDHRQRTGTADTERRRVQENACIASPTSPPKAKIYV